MLLKRLFLLLCCASSLNIANAQAPAQSVNTSTATTAVAPASAASAAEVVLPPGITEEMLAPPPVPGFMLKPPTQPLTVDEMVQQAREAERKAGIKPAK